MFNICLCIHLYYSEYTQSLILFVLSMAKTQSFGMQKKKKSALPKMY